MNSWRPYPLLRLLFPFLAGIIAEFYCGSPICKQGWIVAGMACLLVAAPLFSQIYNNYRLRWISGIIINVFLLFAGYEITRFNRQSNDPDYIGRHPDGLILATIAEPPEKRNASFKAILNIRYRYHEKCWVRACGLAAGFLKCSADAHPLQFGDYVLMHVSLMKIKDNANPHTFNYFQFLGNKNINHRVYAEARDWKPIKIETAGVIRKFAFGLRESLLNILRDNQVTGREFAVASALLLGYVDDLDAGLRRDYAATGAMHILSVSGMHVGIIYVFLEFLLGFLNRRKLLRFLKALILLIFIWFYAMLTGLSPCVFRSAAMLSLPILGKSLNRSPDMFNVIAASVFIILAIDPFLILDVGFQLSYLAVTGIIILYKPIYDLYVTSAWLPDKIWSILAVSVAAQIATLPITQYTFHQFPNYFLLTNIFVVPLSSFIIYTGILVMVTVMIPYLAVVCAKVLVFLVWLLNSIIHFIEQLPFSTIGGIHISAAEMVLLYILIGVGFLYLTHKQITFLYLFLCCCILLALNCLDVRLHRLRSSRLTVYNSYHSGYFQFSQQDKSVVFYGGIAMKDFVKRTDNSEMVKADMEAHGIKYQRAFWSGRAAGRVEIAENFLPVLFFGNFILFSGKKIAILQKSIPKGLGQGIRVDVLILSGNPKISIPDVIKVFHPGQIIIDATNSTLCTLRWLKESASQHIACHSVTEHGAYEKEFYYDVGK